jgi:hypothetical protein
LANQSADRAAVSLFRKLHIWCWLQVIKQQSRGRTVFAK